MCISYVAVYFPLSFFLCVLCLFVFYCDGIDLLSFVQYSGRLPLFTQYSLPRFFVFLIASVFLVSLVRFSSFLCRLTCVLTSYSFSFLFFLTLSSVLFFVFLRVVYLVRLYFVAFAV